MKLNWTHFNPIETYLREVHRIKKDTDYSVCIKYGECIVHCQLAYAKAISEAFTEYRVPLRIVTFKWGNDKGDDEKLREILKETAVNDPGQKDAERYRWLRDRKCCPYAETDDEAWENLDAAIDAAMKELT